jgi:hypothetical protein
MILQKGSISFIIMAKLLLEVAFAMALAMEEVATTVEVAYAKVVTFEQGVVV